MGWGVRGGVGGVGCERGGECLYEREKLCVRERGGVPETAHEGRVMSGRRAMLIMQRKKTRNPHLSSSSELTK